MARAKAAVLANGSISGVDADRFRPDADSRSRVRAELGIAVDSQVLIFVGRLNRDKGLLDLGCAFVSLSTNGHRDLHLLFVGPDEDRMAMKLEHLEGMNAARLHFVSLTMTPERYMAAADVYCLPSYREGFGTALIEAASVGIPGVGSRIYGITDAIDDGKSGLLHEPGDAKSLAAVLDTLLGDGALMRAMGRTARERAVRMFHKDLVTDALVAYIGRALSDSPRPDA